MPPSIACWFTMAEGAVLAVIAAEVVNRADCQSALSRRSPAYRRQRCGTPLVTGPTHSLYPNGRPITWLRFLCEQGGTFHYAAADDLTATLPPQALNQVSHGVTAGNRLLYLLT